MHYISEEDQPLSKDRCTASTVVCHSVVQALGAVQLQASRAAKVPVKGMGILC